ncbi:hypothetical protein HPB47_024605 [Ixodes persulcatus]|uniref:Uncharacterized protein n=1 Tax=Ixodes persulcatus TaxID=34615 RepID=A0AC60Q650_IXOPE|nr:hypothetical protein HPB47_024605 [Ixodes persulcatus]
MVVGLASPWKIPFGYLLTNGVSGLFLKSLLEESIVALEDGGLHVKAVVCDELGANVTEAKLLGCHEVHFIFDACHALKLLRNLLGDKKVLKSEAYAVNTALNCAGTCKFIQDINKCFDLLNSRSPVAHTYKRPFNKANIQERSQMMERVGQNLMQLELPGGQPAVTDGRRMSVIAFAFTLKSVASLATQLLTSGEISCSVPAIYRKLLVHAGVQAPNSANVAADLEGESLTVSQGTINPALDARDDQEGNDPAVVYGLGEDTLSKFTSEVVKYIGGFVSRQVTKTLSCPSCVSMFLDDSVTGVLLTIRDNGRLVYPSELICQLLQETEKIFIGGH